MFKSLLLTSCIVLVASVATHQAYGQKEEKAPNVEKLDGQGFLMEDINLGQLVSFQKVDGDWSAIWGMCGSGRLWVTKTIYPAKVDSKGDLVFQHFPGKHLYEPAKLPRQEIRVRIEQDQTIKIFVDGIRIHADLLRGDGSLFEVQSENEAIHAVQLELGERFTEIVETKMTAEKYLITLKAQKLEGTPDNATFEAIVDKKTGYVKISR